MAAPKVNRAQVTEAVTVELPTSGDGETEKEEARRLARMGSPDAILYLLHTIRDDRASNAQRVRSCSMVLEAGGLLQAESRPTGLFDADARDAGANGREAR